MMYKPFKKMLKHIDLTDEQASKVADILEAVPKKEARQQRMAMMRVMIDMDPEDPSYDQLVEAHANKASSHVRERIAAMAEVRKKIHAILTEDQRDDLRRATEHKMKRIEKRMAKM